MEVMLSVGRYNRYPEIAVKKVIRKGRVNINQDGSVIAPADSRTWDFSAEVPDGYTCVGSYATALFGVTAESGKLYMVDAPAGQVTIYNAGETPVEKTNRILVDGMYGYEVAAVLVCVRDDMVPD